MSLLLFKVPFKAKPSLHPYYQSKAEFQTNSARNSSLKLLASQSKKVDTLEAEVQYMRFKVICRYLSEEDFCFSKNIWWKMSVGIQYYLNNLQCRIFLFYYSYNFCNFKPYLKANFWYFFSKFLPNFLGKIFKNFYKNFLPLFEVNFLKNIFFEKFYFKLK